VPVGQELPWRGMGFWARAVRKSNLEDRTMRYKNLQLKDRADNTVLIRVPL
jgi:hypothetical protein